jgi:hypothetical protein
MRCQACRCVFCHHLHFRSWIIFWGLKSNVSPLHTHRELCEYSPCYLPLLPLISFSYVIGSSNTIPFVAASPFTSHIKVLYDSAADFTSCRVSLSSCVPPLSFSTLHIVLPVQLFSFLRLLWDSYISAAVCQPSVRLHLFVIPSALFFSRIPPFWGFEFRGAALISFTRLRAAAFSGGITQELSLRVFFFPAFLVPLQYFIYVWGGPYTQLRKLSSLWSAGTRPHTSASRRITKSFLAKKKRKNRKEGKRQ